MKALLKSISLATICLVMAQTAYVRAENHEVSGGNPVSPQNHPVAPAKVGQDALASLAVSLREQKNRLLDDQESLTKLQEEMKNAEFWRNAHAGEAFAGAVVAALSVRYLAKGINGIFGPPSKITATGALIGAAALPIGGGVAGGAGIAAMAQEGKRRELMKQTEELQNLIRLRLQHIQRTQAIVEQQSRAKAAESK